MARLVVVALVACKVAAKKDVEVPPVITSAVAKRLVEVAEVEVLLMMSRFVIVDDAAFTRSPSPTVMGERYAPPSIQFDEPPAPVIQVVPFTVKQLARTAHAKVEVADVDVETR